eukprot:288822-Chlamydomonas_euryale.AAC.2
MLRALGCMLRVLGLHTACTCAYARTTSRTLLSARVRVRVAGSGLTKGMPTGQSRSQGYRERTQSGYACV